MDPTDEGPYKGPRTESHIIGEHFSRIGRATEALIWNNTPPELWVGTYGIMVDLADIYCSPWLQSQTYKDAIKDLSFNLPKDDEDWDSIHNYVQERNKQLKAIYLEVHNAGVIYPKEIPLEDARAMLKNMMNDH